LELQLLTSSGALMPIKTTVFKALLDTNIRKSVIWKQLKNYNLFSTFIPGIDKITLTSNTDSEVTAEWFITIDGAPFTWLEVINFNDHDFTMHFEAVCGDFDKWYGEWKVTTTSQECFAIEYQLSYHLGIPVIEDFVGSILHSKIQLFIETMVHAHCKNLRSNTLETRTCKRIKLNKNIEFIADNRVIGAEVIDFSSGGLKIKLQKGILPSNGCKSVDFSFADILNEGFCILDANTDIVRIVFSKSLTTHEMTLILSLWQTELLLTEETVKIYDVITSKSEVSKSHPKFS
jgi:ribosome-associated toxin RatA of RatAB toxin-antitoxin module